MAKQFVMEKKGLLLEFCGEQQKMLYHAWVKGLPDKQLVDIAVTKHRHPKTNAQLGYWYGVLMPFASDELRSAGHNTLFDVGVGSVKTGVDTCPDTADLLLKTLFRAHRNLERLPLKRNMSDSEMGELIDFALAWLAENLGAIAPLPEKEAVTA